MQSIMAGNTSEPPCSNVTEVVDCSQDPFIGMVADSCYTASITSNFSMHLNFSVHLNLSMHMTVELTQNMRGCGVKSNCSTLKNETCGMGMMSQSNPFVEVIQCDFSCCAGDRCNGPSAVNSTSPSASEGSSANPGFSPTTGPTAAALQCTKAPSNAAIFSIVCLVYSAITNLF